MYYLCTSVTINVYINNATIFIWFLSFKNKNMSLMQFLKAVLHTLIFSLVLWVFVSVHNFAQCGDFEESTYSVIAELTLLPLVAASSVIQLDWHVGMHF